MRSSTDRSPSGARNQPVVDGLRRRPKGRRGLRHRRAAALDLAQQRRDVLLGRSRRRPRLSLLAAARGSTGRFLGWLRLGRSAVIGLRNRLLLTCWLRCGVAGEGVCFARIVGIRAAIGLRPAAPGKPQRHQQNRTPESDLRGSCFHGSILGPRKRGVLAVVVEHSFRVRDYHKEGRFPKTGSWLAHLAQTSSRSQFRLQAVAGSFDRLLPPEGATAHVLQLCRDPAQA